MYKTIKKCIIILDMWKKNYGKLFKCSPSDTYKSSKTYSITVYSY